MAKPINLPDDDRELVFEACLELEGELRTRHFKQTNFMQSLIVGREDKDVIEDLRKKIAIIEKKLQRIHKIKYHFTNLYEDISEVKTSAL